MLAVHDEGNNGSENNIFLCARVLTSAVNLRASEYRHRIFYSCRTGPLGDEHGLAKFVLHVPRRSNFKLGSRLRSRIHAYSLFQLHMGASSQSLS